MIQDSDLPALIAGGRVVVDGALRYPRDDTPIESYRLLDRPLPELVRERLMRGAQTPSELARAIGVKRDDTRAVVLDLMNDASLIARGFVLRRTDRVGLSDGRKGTEFRYRLVSIPLPLRIFDPVLGFSLLGWLAKLEEAAFATIPDRTDGIRVHGIARWWELPIERVTEVLAEYPHRLVDSCIGPVPVLEDPSIYQDGARLLTEDPQVVTPLRFRDPTLDAVIASIESLKRARSLSIRESIPAILDLGDAMNFCAASGRPEYMARLTDLNRSFFERFFKGKPVRVRASRIPVDTSAATLSESRPPVDTPSRPWSERHTWRGDGATLLDPEVDGVVFQSGFVRCTVRRQRREGTISLVDDEGCTVQALTRGKGAEEEVHLVVLKSPKRLRPEVDASGPWELTVESWVAASGPDLPLSDEAHGKEVTPPVLLPEGMMLVEVRHSGPGACMVDLIAESGKRRQLCTIARAGFQVVPVFIRNEDAYVFDIWAEGDWSLEAKMVWTRSVRGLPREFKGWRQGITKVFRPRLSSFALSFRFIESGDNELVLHNVQNGESTTIHTGTDGYEETRMIRCNPGDAYLFEVRAEGMWCIAMTDDDPEKSWENAQDLYVLI